MLKYYFNCLTLTNSIRAAFCLLLFGFYYHLNQGKSNLKNKQRKVMKISNDLNQRKPVNMIGHKMLFCLRFLFNSKLNRVKPSFEK